MPDPNIHPLDIKNLEKGSSISKEQILEFWKYHFPDKEWNEFSLMEIKEKIMYNTPKRTKTFSSTSK